MSKPDKPSFVRAQLVAMPTCLSWSRKNVLKNIREKYTVHWVREIFNWSTPKHKLEKWFIISGDGVRPSVRTYDVQNKTNRSKIKPLFKLVVDAWAWIIVRLKSYIHYTHSYYQLVLFTFIHMFYKKTKF